MKLSSICFMVGAAMGAAFIGLALAVAWATSSEDLQDSLALTAALCALIGVLGTIAGVELRDVGR